MNISPACAEGDCFPALFPRADRGYSLQISIHALFAEGDRRYAYAFRTGACISIHALFAEGDSPETCPSAQVMLFLSTPSSQRATRHPALPWLRMAHFYPRPLRRGRRRRPA